MVTYPDLSNLSNSSGIGGLMSLPNSSYPYFWAWILGAIWFVITLTLYFKEKDKLGSEAILSSMAVSSLAIIILAVIGTALTIVTLDIMVYILVICLMIIALWFFSGD